MAYKRRWKKKYGYRKKNYRWRRRTTRKRYNRRGKSAKAYCNRLAKKNLFSAKSRYLVPKSYSGIRVFNTFKLRAFPFGVGDFNIAGAGRAKGHYTYDFTLNDIMDQNDLNEMKEYKNWIIKSLTITYSIRDFNNLNKFTQLTATVPTQYYEFDRIGQEDVFKFYVGMFDNSQMQEDCASLTTYYDGTNLSTIVQNKVQLRNTRAYKQLTLKGNKAVFRWLNSNATAQNMPAMTAIPSLSQSLDATWMLGTPVGRTPHGIDVNWLDTNFYFETAQAIYNPSVIMYQGISAVVLCKNRNPVP